MSLSSKNQFLSYVLLLNIIEGGMGALPPQLTAYTSFLHTLKKRSGYAYDHKINYSINVNNLPYLIYLLISYYNYIISMVIIGLIFEKYKIQNSKTQVTPITK